MATESIATLSVRSLHLGNTVMEVRFKESVIPRPVLTFNKGEDVGVPQLQKLQHHYHQVVLMLFVLQL
jgi:hypothetical protein